MNYENNIIIKQSHERIVIKTLIYRILGVLITFIGGMLFTNNIKSAITVTMLIEIIQTIVYFIYEESWNKINWGMLYN
tara:strand:- start:209 stop:442 length:234 start_codon:yes stop_codon:yes gene_type:complete